MDSNVEPKLGAPGAGLPAIEHLIGRMMFAWRRMTGTPESFNADFQRERESIRRMLSSLSPEVAGRRVLINRPPGLEDSSRYWSVWMVLDHLRIVHGSMIRIFGALMKGVVPPGQASTATVKPSPVVTDAVVAEYEKSCDDLLAIVAAAPDLKTSARYVHPWFGALDAAGWHALAAGHIKIHRVQIERIIAGLTRDHCSVSTL
jgi:hypothetical protein